MHKILQQLVMAIFAIVAFTGCAPQFMRMPPPTVTADANGRVHVTYPNPQHVAGRAVHNAFGPVLYERTRNGGTELSDGWTEFLTDQRRVEFILDPIGDVASAYVKYKGVVFGRSIRGPSWNFTLPNMYNSGTRDYELWVRREDESEEYVMTITVISSPPVALRPRRGR